MQTFLMAMGCRLLGANTFTVELPTLKDHRLELKLGQLFKILYELCYFPESHSYTNRNPWPSKSAHCLQLTVPFAHIYTLFFPHTLHH